MNSTKKLPVIFFLKCLLISYLFTALLLLLLAFLLYSLQLGEKVVSILIIAIYVLATFLGGFLCGKKMESKRFLWGCSMGVLYFLVLAIASLFVKQGFGNLGNDFLTTFVLCAGGGMLGGMLS